VSVHCAPLSTLVVEALRTLVAHRFHASIWISRWWVPTPTSRQSPQRALELLAWLPRCRGHASYLRRRAR